MPRSRGGTRCPPAPGREPQRAARRRASGPRVRERHSNRVRCRSALGSAVRDPERELRGRDPQRRNGEVESAAHDGSSRLLDRAREQQLRRTVRRAAQRLAQYRMGTLAGRSPAPLSDCPELAGPAQPERQPGARRQHRYALQHHDRLRRQQRFAVQRSAGRRRPEQRPHDVAGDGLGEPLLLAPGRRDDGVTRASRSAAAIVGTVAGRQQENTVWSSCWPSTTSRTGRTIPGSTVSRRRPSF